jgi:hypothetical protein
VEESFAKPEVASNAAELNKKQLELSVLKKQIAEQENIYERAFEAMMELEA